MLGVVSELVDRYGAHPSFRGVGVQLSADGYAQLPGTDGSYDDETIAAFERETKIAGVRRGSGRRGFAARARFLTGPESRGWLAWRAENLADLPADGPGDRRCAQGRSAVPGRRNDVRGLRRCRRSLRPALPRRMRLDDVLMGLGLQSRRASATIRSSSCGRRASSRWTRSRLHAVDLELNLAPEVDRLFAGAAGREPVLSRAAEAAAGVVRRQESRSAARTPTPGWSRSSRLRDLHNRERFIHSLATLDAQAMFDGGWLLPLGQEETIRELLSVYRELPGRRIRDGRRRNSAGGDSPAGCKNDADVRLPGQRFAVERDACD